MTSVLDPKRRRVVLTYRQRLEILHEMKKGTKHADIAQKYGVGLSTVSDIKRYKNSIMAFVSNLKSNDQAATVRTRKKPLSNLMDQEVYEWYVSHQEKNMMVPPTEQELSTKALAVNKALGGPEEFKASSGWIRQFKQRHMLILNQSLLSANATPQTICKDFKNLMKRGGYTAANIYAVNELVLEWKTLPHYQQHPHVGQSDMVTVVVCANATGTHKIPLLILGAPKRQRKASECRHLTNCLYVRKHDSCTNVFIFAKWFEEVFKPEVCNRLHQSGNQVDEKILLVLNDSPWHPFHDSLIKGETNFEATFIPENYGALLHPMLQGMEKHFRIDYRKGILDRLHQSGAIGKEEFLEQYGIDEAIECFDQVWGDFNKYSLSKTWRKLFIHPDRAVNLLHCEETEVIARRYTALTYFDIDTIVPWLEEEKDYLDFYNTLQNIPEDLDASSDEEFDFTPRHVPEEEPALKSELNSPVSDDKCGVLKSPEELIVKDEHLA